MKSKLGTSKILPALALICLVSLVACSTKTKQIFFDIQPPTKKELAEKELQRQTELIEAQSKELKERHSSRTGGAIFNLEDNAPRPEIESIMEWDQAKKMLPKDYKKNIDWSSALERGLIRPRVGTETSSLWATAFKWDFIIKGEEPDDDAYFPHSAHTMWLGCKNCHNPDLYPYKRNPTTMKEMKRGASCGAIR